MSTNPDKTPPISPGTSSETLGSLIKAAREKKGLSIPELAKITRIKMQQIDGLERDDFSSIPAPTYGKGFVKLIAQVLEVDGTALAARYQAQVDAQPSAPKARETPRPAPPKSQPRPGAALFSPPELEPASGASPGGPAHRPARDPRVDTLPLPPAADVPEPAGTGDRASPRPGILTPPRAARIVKEDLLHRWPLRVVVLLFVLCLLFLPRACRRGRQPDPLLFPDLGGAELPLLAVPDTPLFDLPQNTP